MSIEVEAGITTGELLEKLAPDNIFYPIDIENLNSTLGGQVRASTTAEKNICIKAAVSGPGLEFVSLKGGNQCWRKNSKKC